MVCLLAMLSHCLSRSGLLSITSQIAILIWSEVSILKNVIYGCTLHWCNTIANHPNCIANKHWLRWVSGSLSPDSGPCLTTAIWRCRKNSSQWQRSFQMKAALPLAKILARASCRSSNKGPSELSITCRTSSLTRPSSRRSGLRVILPLWYLTEVLALRNSKQCNSPKTLTYVMWTSWATAPFYWQGLTWISASISNCIHYT